MSVCNPADPGDPGDSAKVCKELCLASAHRPLNLVLTAWVVPGFCLGWCVGGCGRVVKVRVGGAGWYRVVYGAAGCMVT